MSRRSRGHCPYGTCTRRGSVEKAGGLSAHPKLLHPDSKQQAQGPRIKCTLTTLPTAIVPTVAGGSAWDQQQAWSHGPNTARPKNLQQHLHNTTPEKQNRGDETTEQCKGGQITGLVQDQAQHRGVAQPFRCLGGTGTAMGDCGQSTQSQGPEPTWDS